MKGKKYDNEKLPMNLIPVEVLEKLAEVLKFGAEKYGPNNWKSLKNAEERYTAAALRHFYAHLKGEYLDKESGLTHLSHALTNLVFLSWFNIQKPKEKDPGLDILKYTLKGTPYHPKRGSKGSSGIDVFSPKKYIVEPFCDVLIPTGVHFDIPKGYDLSLYNKSSVCTKQKLIKGAELIDEDYTGEVHVHLFNFSRKPVIIQKGTKIAQFVLRPVKITKLVQVDKIKKVTERQANGFGSTGASYERI